MGMHQLILRMILALLAFVPGDVRGQVCIQGAKQTNVKIGACAAISEVTPAACTWGSAWAPGPGRWYYSMAPQTAAYRTSWGESVQAVEKAWMAFKTGQAQTYTEEFAGVGTYFPGPSAQNFMGTNSFVRHLSNASECEMNSHQLGCQFIKASARTKAGVGCAWICAFTKFILGPGGPYSTCTWRDNCNSILIPVPSCESYTEMYSDVCFNTTAIEISKVKTILRS